MTPGGDGMYYFFTFNVVDAGEYAVLNLKVNRDILCQIQHDSNDSPDERGTGTCAVTQILEEGETLTFLPSGGPRGRQKRHSFSLNYSCSFFGYIFAK